MEIDITAFAHDEDPWDYSASVAERGEFAGRDTWTDAGAFAAREPWLTEPDQIEEAKAYFAGYGAWEDEEIAAWTMSHVNALIVQEVSHALREMGWDGDFPEYFDWDAYEADEGVTHVVYRGGDGRLFFYLGT